MGNKNFLQDEQGSKSSGRLSWWLAFPWIVILITFDVVGIATITPVAYGFLGTLILFLGSWIAGPRMAQYVLPQIGKIADSLAQGKLDSSFPDRFKDDERGVPVDDE